MSEVNEYIKSVSGQRVKSIVMLASVSLILSLLLSYGFYQLTVNRPASQILGGLKALWHWNLTQDVQLSSYDEMGDIEKYINVTMENIRAQSEQLKEAIGKAGGDASSAKGDFFTGASHKIRTLLSAVIGMAAIGKNTDDTGRKNYALDKIEDASTHLLGVINDTMSIGTGKEHADQAEPAQQAGLTKQAGKAPLAGQTAKKPAKSIIPVFPGRCILLAEDVEINREIVLTMLEPTQAEIDCAGNGAAALRRFSETPEKYDMVFMDVQMPEMDGYEATKRIRALGTAKAKTVPIVAMTANVFQEDIQKCLDAGMNSHLGKPLDFDEVFSKMREYLG
jgi:CheY-like chemotaxis protein